MKIAKKQLEVAGILHLYGDDYKQNRLLPLSHKKVIHHLKACRTSQLGGHVEACTECGFEKIAYNSCRDRHCPKCQTMTKEQWINDRKAELLPCGYFQTSSWLRRANLIDKLFAFGMSEEIKPRRAYFSHPFLPSLPPIIKISHQAINVIGYFKIPDDFFEKFWEVKRCIVWRWSKEM